MKRIVKSIICIVMITVLMSLMVFPASATITRPSTTKRPSIVRPLPGVTPIETTQESEPEETYKTLAPVARPLPGVTVKPTEATEPSSGGTTTKPGRPLPGESDLIPITPTETTTPSSGGTTTKPVRPLPDGSELIPITPTEATTPTLPSKNPAATKPTEPAATKATTPPASKSPYFTKHPTGETIKEGANAQFVAIAENADGYNWIILSADGQETYTIKEACSHFTGLKAEGSITTRLTLYYIPASLNGYYVACIAEGNGETVTSNGALLSIQSKNPPVQLKETEPATEPTVETTPETTVQTTPETTVTETTQTETVETEETTQTVATEQKEENNDQSTRGLYLIGGVCVALLAAAVVLIIILLKTLHKGKRR